MAIKQDVLVIGGGIAGLTTALTVAREGVDVRLVSYKETTLRNASGLIDVLGYTPDGEGPIAEPFEELPELNADHPYSIVGTETLRDGLALFDDVTGDAYLGEHTETNVMVPTHGGTVKPTSRYPAMSAAGLASDDRDMLVVGLDRLTDFDAPITADHLDAAGVPFDVHGKTIQFPLAVRDDAKVTRYAKILDENRDISYEGRTTGARQALAETVKPHLDGAARVGFPAILGHDHHDDIRADLERELGADVFEVPMGPPSLPGLRLEDHLYAALDAEGARIETGSPIVGCETENGVVETVYMKRNERRVPYEAEQFVLATGGLASDGITSDREGVYEPIFDCYIPHPDDRYEWFVDDVFGEQPYPRFGVNVDDDLQPLDSDGDPEYANLRAAGSIIGNYDFPAEKSGSGVSIATGYAAGRKAATEV